MINNFNNKCIYLAQYFGQPVLKYISKDGKEHYYSKDGWYSGQWCSPNFDGRMYVELTPLNKISDEHAIALANIILKNDMNIYRFEFKNEIRRTAYDVQWGVDAEESIDLTFKGIVNEGFKTGGWKDTDFRVKLVVEDRYNDLPYFAVYSKEIQEDYNVETMKTWSYHHIKTQLEGFDYLKANGYIVPFGELSDKELINRGWARLKDFGIYDFVAIADMLSRSEILTNEEMTDLKKEMLTHTFFTNRRKILIDNFNIIISEKDYKEKVSKFIQEKAYAFTF